LLVFHAEFFETKFGKVPNDVARISKWPGPPDRILIQKGVRVKNDYQHVRRAGFVYTTAQPNTEPLYRCYSDAEHSHFASNGESCNNMGKREALLGYILRD
jgi:hypothetical protein